ncbi:hypothetical protein A6R68_22954, partial [Neotoma lepida]
DLFCTWEEDRKLVLRGWSLVFIFLATLLVFSVVDGRMAYVHGPYTGFIGLWIDCRRHKCANQQPSLDQSSEPTQNQFAASSFVSYHEAPHRGDSATSQDTEKSPQPDASTSVLVTPSDLP